MIIGAYAIGASEGVIYVRAEYPLAISRLEIAMEQAREKATWVRISWEAFFFRSSHQSRRRGFRLREETALIASLEGERGMPRLKPPFPAQKGFRVNPQISTT